ncbi:MAG: hypothetical protein EOQ94_27595 [Mesorhizobium sp.]|nr:MAG: hypothetical protein EOQ94_27595 [Mesorhizobium sp.]TIQ94174.1 MAG: hypothetical protein E5X36_27585 [Mesorhizobium sp.]
MDSHDGDAYDLTYVQLSGADSLLLGGDGEIRRTITIGTGATYVFDNGYCHYGCGRRSPGPEPPRHPAKSNMGWRCCTNALSRSQGDDAKVFNCERKMEQEQLQRRCQ